METTENKKPKEIKTKKSNFEKKTEKKPRTKKPDSESATVSKRKPTSDKTERPVRRSSSRDGGSTGRRFGGAPGSERREGSEGRPVRRSSSIPNPSF